MVLVTGSLGVGYLAGGQMNVRTITSTAFVSSTATAFSVVTSTQTITTTLPQAPPAGISLQVSVNGTTMAEGDDVAITATLFSSPIGQDNIVSPSDNWPVYGLLMFNQNFPPCLFHSPFELVVLKGDYSSSQLMAMGSTGTPAYTCMENTYVIGFTFAPNSTLARITSLYDVTDGISTYGPVNASVTVTTNGYWDNSSSMAYSVAYSGLGNYNQFPAEHPFVEGVYTIAIGDEWGQLVVIHITVE